VITYVEQSDDGNTSTPDSPTCVEGYDLIVDKYAYTDRDTDTGDSINTYPANIASGIIYSGDRVVYHVNVTNDGPGDVYGVDWSDLLDPGMELFEYANVTTESGLTITIPGGSGFDQVIDPLLVGVAYQIDIFAELNGAGYT
jgi:uncharacterized repeat protein (TIGR01451 family)